MIEQKIDQLLNAIQDQKNYISVDQQQLATNLSRRIHQLRRQIESEISIMQEREKILLLSKILRKVEMLKSQMSQYLQQRNDLIQEYNNIFLSTKKDLFDDEAISLPDERNIVAHQLNITNKQIWSMENQIELLLSLLDPTRSSNLYKRGFKENITPNRFSLVDDGMSFEIPPATKKRSFGGKKMRKTNYKKRNTKRKKYGKSKLRK